MRSGASAESTDEESTTALYLAAVQDRPAVVRLLLAAGADPDRASGRDAADLPLCGAACGGHTEVVDALLSAGRSRICARSSIHGAALGGRSGPCGDR
ncbi:ankyrin repeat domain-containing protein [Streptomyces sp. M10(2022)]